jgi:hypothetical protein
MKKKKTGGRQKGTPNKLTKISEDLVAVAMSSGITPLEVMLENMRPNRVLATRLDAELIAGDDPIDSEAAERRLAVIAQQAAMYRQKCEECARDAANCVHPKLQAIEHSGGEFGYSLASKSG